MDIDDILASVSGEHDAPSAIRDLHALTRAWVAERSAPELLPYPSGIVDRVSTRISAQIATVEDLTSALDPSANFALVVIQTDLERAKFLLRALLRTRLAKMDRFARHYLSLSDQQSGGREEKNPLLSGTEKQYLAHHSAMLDAHYAASFLGSFPPALQRMDDTAGGIGMVDRPDEETAVFVRILRDGDEAVEVQGEHGAAEIELRRGDVWVLRWKSVRDRVLRGDVELI
ncbi:DNA replication complex GINS protein SLD5 [Myriangium duriaei CBS 260.36]|uniref:DNA replication complex GINS protein SLD5 n=1 Tax=Myriangium duriaei CBS 260.36 TaxID=1168546 RepID=A0A9P4MQ37_9PEZI|nr:DNA replication complex GINS protein SLD5 [Myriangium duriaei CBS 260.36]